MNIVTSGYPVSVSKRFVAILEKEISRASINPSETVVLNFRDPDYSLESGGFHPVEIMIVDGRIRYVTDFAYYGTGPWAELGKDLNFDFSLGLFQQQGRDYPIERGRSMFRLWTKNFCAYYQMGAYEVEITNG